MEKAYRQFINYSLGVNKKAPNDGSWGESGRCLGITILILKSYEVPFGLRISAHPVSSSLLIGLAFANAC